MPLNVRAAIAHGAHRPLEIETVALDGPAADEVLVEMRSAGLCHTDFHFLDGSLPGIFPMLLGHEGGGIVVECGRDVKGLKPGDKVIPAVVPECRQCDLCLSGRTNLCREHLVPFTARRKPISLDGEPVIALASLGTFATHAVIREISLAKVRDDAPMDLISFIGCGVVTGLGAAIATAEVRPGSSVVVFGLGAVGLNVVQGAHFCGATTIVGVDVNPAKAAAAKRMGATHFVDGRDAGRATEEILDLTGGGGDYTFECVGNVRLQRQALECARVGWGLCTLVGVAPQGQELSFPPGLLQRGRRIAGSLMGDMKARHVLPRLVDWCAEGRIKVEELITRRLTLDEINTGFELMRAGEGIRSLVVY